jgi:hypothetical protein
MWFKPKKKTIVTNASLMTPHTLAIEVFGCLHKKANVFLQDCANAIWNMKGLESPHLSILVTFLCKKVSITLQRMQDVHILSWKIIVGLIISRLPPPQDTPPITMTNLLHTIDF